MCRNPSADHKDTKHIFNAHPDMPGWWPKDLGWSSYAVNNMKVKQARELLQELQIWKREQLVSMACQ